MEQFITQAEMLKFAIEKYDDDALTQYLFKIVSDEASTSKKINMRESAKYYNIENTAILGRDNSSEYRESNQKILNTFHRDIVDQKVSYICSKPISILSDNDDENIINDIYSVIGEDFDKKVNYWVTNTSIYGDGWLYVYVDINNNFKYEVINSDEIMAIYKDEFENELLYVIRYFQTFLVDKDSGEKQKINIIEVYDNNYKYGFITEGEGKLLKKYVESHFKKIETNKALDTTNVTDYSFNKVPFIRIKNNKNSTDDLIQYRHEIDDFDLHMSDASNNLAEIQNVIWVLKNYDGQDLKEFMSNLKAFKSIKVGQNGDVDTKSFEIPFQAREAHLNRLREIIYEAGNGIDLSSNKFGDNPTNQTLKTMYSKLDMASKKLILTMKDSLKEFMYFVCYYINFNEKKNYDYTTISYQFNLATVTNESEVITNLINSKAAGIISAETAVAKNPLVDDVNIEIENIKQNLIDTANAYMNVSDEDTEKEDFQEFEVSGSAA